MLGFKRIGGCQMIIFDCVGDARCSITTQGEWVIDKRTFHQKSRMADPTVFRRREEMTQLLSRIDSHHSDGGVYKSDG